MAASCNEATVFPPYGKSAFGVLLRQAKRLSDIVQKIKSVARSYATAFEQKKGTYLQIWW